MKYKYIGTEEQLVERGFIVDTSNSRIGYIWYDKDCILEKKSFGDLITILIKNYNNPKDEDIRLIMFNLEYTHKNDDITPYIQDLIDDGLVEVIK